MKRWRVIIYNAGHAGVVGQHLFKNEENASTYAQEQVRIREASSAEVVEIKAAVVPAPGVRVYEGSL